MQSDIDKLAKMISYILFLRLILVIVIISTMFNMTIKKPVVKSMLLYSFKFFSGYTGPSWSLFSNIVFQHVYDRDTTVNYFLSQTFFTWLNLLTYLWMTWYHLWLQWPHRAKYLLQSCHHNKRFFHNNKQRDFSYNKV